MGGKHKQAQRVKNNARPSSSGRSAERLGAAVAAPFASAFAVRKESGVRVGTLSQTSTMDEPLPQLDPTLDPQFQLVLKKMSKKDGTTKLKALQEFRQLVDASDVEAVCLVTGLWCRVYVGLLSGGDGRVREAAHRAQEAVCSRAGRSLAPHVRLLAAPWLAAVHDTYGPAAQAARDSLHAAFPDAERRAELAARCRRQLLRQALDVLTAADTTEARVVSCALLAAASACAQSSVSVGEQDSEAAALLRKLLEDERFWGCAKAREGRECERVALAAVLAAASRDPWREAAAVDVNRVLRAAIRALLHDDCASDATPALWDAVLLLLPHCGQDAQQNARADLLKPLAERLRDPPPAYVSRTCPVLLPLLARLEQPTVGMRDAFAGPLLDALLTCMSLPRVQHSRTELRAAAAAYMDVAQWTAAADAPAECVRRVLCSADTCRNARVIHGELTRLMRRWRADSAWQRLADLAVRARGSELPHVADVLVWLARPVTVQDGRPQYKRVTFGDVDVSEEACAASSLAAATAHLAVDEDPGYSIRVDELCGKAADEWLRRCEEPHATSAVCALLNARRTLPLPTTAANALEECVLPALHCATGSDVPQLIELAFQLLGRPGNEQRQKHALDSLPAAYVTHAILLAQHEPHLSQPVVREWLRVSPLVREAYERAARDAAALSTADVPDEEEDSSTIGGCAVDDCELLVRALRSRPPLCDAQCVMNVSCVLRDALLVGRCTRDLYRLAAAACEHAPDLLAAPLLAVACAPGELIDAQVVWDVDTAWRDALRDRPTELLGPLSDKLVELASVVEFRPDYNDRLVKCAVTLVEACDGSDSAHVLMRQHLPEVERALVRRVALAQHVSGRDANGAHDIMTISDEMQTPSANNFAAWLGWRRLIARTTIYFHDKSQAPTTQDVSNDENEHTSITDLPTSVDLPSLVALVLGDYSLVACHARHYTHTDDTGMVRVWLEDMRRICDRISTAISMSSWMDAAPVEATADESEGITWAACTAYLATQGLLPGGDGKIVPLPGRVPHAGHVARALSAERILDPRRVPPAHSCLGPLEATRLSLLAGPEDDLTACATASAEAVHALRILGAEPPADQRKLADACLLLGVALLRTPASHLPALLDLATVRVAAWSRAAVDGHDPRTVSAYCQLATEHSSALQRYAVLDGGVRAAEHEQLFASDVRSAIVRAYSTCVKLASESTAAAWPLCRAVGCAITLLVPAGGMASDDEAELWRVSLRALCPPNHVRCVPVQLLAYSILRRLCDAAAAADDDRSCQPVAAVDLRAALANAQDAISTENNDLHAVLGLVLAWDAAAAVHAAWEQPRADLLLGCVLDLVPRDACDEWFACEPTTAAYQIDDRWAAGPEYVIARAACLAYTRWLCVAGAAARAWWLSVPVASDRQRAEQLAARHVTRRVVRHQLQAARLPHGVTCQTAGRHVQAECHVEDARIELRLELGESWPLGQRPPHVEARPQPHRDRLMQLTLAAAAGAPLHRLLRLWKEAVDSRYEGLDECHICFSLLHAATAQLPRLRCPTCRKTFHSACLYRWFSTSNKSTCPICRNLF